MGVGVLQTLEICTIIEYLGLLGANLFRGGGGGGGVVSFVEIEGVDLLF